MKTPFPSVFVEYRPLARRLAHRLFLRARRSVPEEDLEAAALVGLWDAWKRFLPDKRKSFRSYAAVKMTFAMQDWLREADYLPRTLRKQHPDRRLGSIEEETTNDYGPLMLKDLIDDGRFAEEREDEVLAERCDRLRRGLKWRTRIMLRLYFDMGWLMQDIAEAFSLSESSVSVILKETFALMRERR